MLSAAGCLGSIPWLKSLEQWRAKLQERRLSAGLGRGAMNFALEWGGLALLGVVFVLSCCMLSAGTYNPFIYFRF